MSEQRIQQEIRLALGNGTARLWRNNVGTGWAGQATKITAGNLRAVQFSIRPGDVLVRQGRPLHAGLCKGSSDLIGLRSITIGPEHLGQTLAVFAAVEVKAPTGRTTPDQRAFIDAVAAMGGLAGVARSVEDAAQILQIDRGSMQNPNQSPIVSPPAQLHGNPDLPPRH